MGVRRRVKTWANTGGLAPEAGDRSPLSGAARGGSGAGGGSSGGGVAFQPSLKFNDARDSQYAGLWG